MTDTYAVIMAGGGGTRLWPLSRRNTPKHLLPLLGENSLFATTVQRLQGWLPPERILIVTTEAQVEALRSQAPEIPPANFLLEPEPRGTAAVIGLAAALLARRNPQAVMCVLPSDHHIGNPQAFRQTLETAIVAAQEGFLVTLGIPPSFPATGYGYIQRAEPLPGAFRQPVYRARRFIEKPNEERARQLIADGEHYWNSGIFIWRVDVILQEIQRLMPDLSTALGHIQAAWGTPDQETVFRSAWLPLRTETIDYGVMEHATNVAVVPAPGMDWNDVGAWDSLFLVSATDGQGNLVRNADFLPLETRRTLVYTREEKLVATIGVEDLIIVDTGDALLVCRRGQSQQVRRLIDVLKQRGQEEYL